MSTLSLTLCASTRTGCLSAAISACAEVTLTLAGDLPLPAGTSLALLTPRGTTLAHTILSEEAAPGAALPLSTLTAQAAEYTRSCRAGDTREALLAIGDSEHPLALVPARIAQNPLYTLAPPTAQAPVYPTSEALHALLAEIQAAALSAENAQASATSAQSKAEAAQGAAEAAATSASDSAKVAGDSEQAAISAKQAAEASQVQAKASETAAKASETAAKGSETAASASEKAAKASEQAAAESATAAAGNASAAKASEQAAASSSTSAAKSAASSATSANAAANSATAAGKSATSAAASASAAAGSATDLAEAVETAESLDGRISKIEGLGTQYKRDFRVNTTFLVNPLATSLATSSPFASIYRITNEGYNVRYFSDCQHHIFNHPDAASIYDASGKYLGMISNTGIGFTVSHEAYRFACLTTQIGDYRYGVFNGYPYSKNKMIISKFSRNAYNTDYQLVSSRVYATRGVEGAVFQWGGSHHYVGPVVPSRRTGHILVFGEYYMSVKNDEGNIVDQYVGYGYIVFDSDLNFVKWDEDTGAFVSSETFDMSYFHAVGNRLVGGSTAYWAWQNPQYPSIVAISQKTNATNGLYYVDPHDNLVPITFSRGPYADVGVDYLPLGGSLLSVDSNALFSTYAPRLVMSGVESDSERNKACVVKIFNGARMYLISMTLTDEEPGCTFNYRGGSYTITKSQFNGSRISDGNYLFLHGRYVSSYSETELFLYRNGYIYSSDGKYVRSLSLALSLAQISPQRGMYARSSHLQFAPCGGYENPTGAVLLDM